ncbi:MAG: glycosyltransferase family 1 protein, partial [Bacteroidota bacterium]
VRKSKKVITVSEYEKERINKHFGFGDQRLTAIYNGVGEHFVKITDAEHLRKVKEQYRLPERFFFFLGNTDPKKNTRGVLKAFAQFNQMNSNTYQLVMLDYDEHELQKLLAEMGASSLRAAIHLTGYVPNTDLPALISQCSVFLYPSLRESFGIPILEGMACGVPVITSNTSSMPEVAGENTALLVDPYDTNAIFEALNTLVEDEALAIVLAENGIERAKKFSWETMANNVLQLYENVHHELEKSEA